MTYTIIGRCARTGDIGVAVATYSVVVGSLCPAAMSHVGAVTSQAFVDPELKTLALSLLAQGHSAEGALDLLLRNGSDLQYRQIGLIDREGRTAVHTGQANRMWAGSRSGPNHSALGNVLVGEEVVVEMAAAFQESEAQALPERLLRALEAGRDAGGQIGSTGPLPERSASLLVRGRSEFDGMDLRVDMHPTAVEELRRIHDSYLPYMPFNRLRWLKPAEAPPQEAFVASLKNGS